MSYTLVSFHAHPDDEVLLTAGTLAKAAADGHRVVLVVATDGAAGLSDPALLAQLGARRRSEQEAAAKTLGAAHVVWLGYGDSGWHESARSGGFTDVPVEEAAVALARILRAEGADALTSYDAAGGYGHPDHIRVHEVGERAAELAGTRLVLEATIDRTLIRRAVRLVGWLPFVTERAAGAANAFTPSDLITHEIDVRRFADSKRAAMRAHESQTSGGKGLRTLALLLRLPRPVFRAVLGREWFTEPGRPVDPVGGRANDIFASLREDE